MQMSTKNYSKVDTKEIKIFVSGSYDKIKEICQEFCLKGLCVSLKAVDYVYTMGSESGVEVTLINYPRFPKTKEEILLEALELGEKLTIGCHQGSFTLVDSEKTYFWSRRETDQ